jgi:hypothetical protein
MEPKDGSREEWTVNSMRSQYSYRDVRKYLQKEYGVKGKAIPVTRRGGP